MSFCASTCQRGQIYHKHRTEIFSQCLSAKHNRFAVCVCVSLLYMKYSEWMFTISAQCNLKKCNLVFSWPHICTSTVPIQSSETWLIQSQWGNRGRKIDTIIPNTRITNDKSKMLESLPNPVLFLAACNTRHAAYPLDFNVRNSHLKFCFIKIAVKNSMLKNVTTTTILGK